MQRFNFLLRPVSPNTGRLCYSWENLKYMRIRKREIALPIACQQEGGIINLLVLFQFTFSPSVDQLFFSSRVSVFNCGRSSTGFIARFDEVKEG